MVFSSIPFLFYFLPVFLALYFLAGRMRNGVLLVFSLLFYAVGEPTNLVFLLLFIGFNYLVGVELARHEGRERKAWLAAGIAADLALLGFFKYAGFFATGLNGLLAPLELALPVLQTVLPLGISFVTFQAVSYLVDVYRRDVPPERSPLLLAVYIAMFPHLIAGPIVRFKTVVRDLHQRRLSLSGFNTGAVYLIVGLAQKTLIADSLAPLADGVFGTPVEQLGTLVAWLGIIAYSLQIYFDFAGYSNMAIGLARMMGIGFPRNFDYPYVSASLTEFWRRWHLSLSQWFRDYLYIPLGGNRGSALRTYANLTAVFLLCGLWHGAGLTFIAWGAYHGLLLVIERLGFAALLTRLWRPLRHAYALLVIMVGWVLFRSADFAQVLGYLRAMAGFAQFDGLGTSAPLFQLDTRIALLAGIVASLPVLPWLREQIARCAASCPALLPVGGAAAVTGLALLLALSTLVLAGATYKPFIYFRF